MASTSPFQVDIESVEYPSPSPRCPDPKCLEREDGGGGRQEILLLPRKSERKLLAMLIFRGGKFTVLDMIISNPPIHT